MGQQIVACSSRLSQYCERVREETNAGCCGGVIKQLSEKDNVL